ncbi:MAG: 30S ribosomal protein S16 [Clostridia bacterium]|nr:30S ribosomal protein S16 [Clostridia bacterium]
MAARIRLMRMGTKKKPFYRVVVADTRAPRSGRFLEELGYYNPLREPAQIYLKEEKVLEWLKKGATPSDTARQLLVRTGIWEKFGTGGRVEEEGDERAG